MLEDEFTLMKSQIVGRSQSTKNLLIQVQRLSRVDSTVLITGDSGVGKSHVAEAIHNCSPWGDNTLIKIDCMQLEKFTLEQEVLSVIQHADNLRPAISSEPVYTSLLLEEISELSLQHQKTLLHLLEDKQIYQRHGRIQCCVNLRILATTQQNLHTMVSQGKFRKDLYFRLRVAEVKLPALNTHSEDISDLVNHFITLYNQKFNQQVTGVSPRAMRALSSHPWAGNVRELQHAIERSMIFCNGPFLEQKYLPAALNIVTEESEKERIECALKDAAGNESLAAKSLGVSRRTIYRKIEELGISGLRLI